MLYNMLLAQILGSANLHLRNGGTMCRVWRVPLNAILTPLLLGWFVACTDMGEADPVDQEFVIIPEPTALLANRGGTDMAISPDGSRIVHVAESEGTAQLYVRPMGRSMWQRRGVSIYPKNGPIYPSDSYINQLILPSKPLRLII